MKMCDLYLISAHKEDILNILSEDNIETHFSININFLELFESNTNLGSALLDNPEQSLIDWDNAAQKVQHTLLQGHEVELKPKINIHCRIHSLPPWPHVSRTTFPTNEDAQKFLQVTGTVVRISAPKLLEYQREYICVKCKYPISVKAIFDKRNVIKPPKICPNPEGCNGKNIITFGGINRDNCKDYQEIKIQEDLSKVGTRNIPNTMCVALEDDLVNICKPGESVTVCGIVKRTWSEFCIGRKIDVTLVLKANYVQVNSKTNLVVSPEDHTEFKNFWKKHCVDPLLGRTLILKSICPEIYGLDLVKLAIAIVLAGGSQNETFPSTGLDIRSEAHLLLVGDPGTGKSQLLQFASKMITRSVLTTGVGSTAAGLTVSAFMEKGEWKLEAGALVMSDGGICCIDEFNSMKEHDRTTIHEAMEQQTISVAKAGIVCRLRTRCSILAACNPKGNLDPTEPLCMNIAMASPLLSRFDLVLLIKDSVNEEWDSELADYILDGLDINRDVPWSLEKLQSYFVIIKTLNPKLTDDAELILSKYYQLQRNSGNRNKSRTTVRLLESLIRLSQGHARLLFHQDVEVIDAIFAIILADTSMDYESSLLNVKVNNCTFFDHPVDFYRDALIALLPKLELEHILEKELLHLNIKNTQTDNHDIIQIQNVQKQEIDTRNVIKNNDNTIFSQNAPKNNSKENKKLFTDIDLDEEFFNDFSDARPKPKVTKELEKSSIENTQNKQTKNYNSLTHNFKNRPSTSKTITSHLSTMKSAYDKNKPTISQHNSFLDITRHNFANIHWDNMDLDENIFNDSNSVNIASTSKTTKLLADRNDFSKELFRPSTSKSISQENIVKNSTNNRQNLEKKDDNININKSLPQKYVESLEKESEINSENIVSISKNTDNKDTSVNNSNNKVNTFLNQFKFVRRPVSTKEEKTTPSNLKITKENTEESNTTNRTSLVSQSVLMSKSYQNEKENFQNMETNNESTETNKIYNTTNLEFTTNKKQQKRDKSPAINEENNIQSDRIVTKKAKKNNDKTKGQLNEIDMLKLMPSVNDDLLNFDLDWDNFEKEFSQNIEQGVATASKRNSFLGNFKSFDRKPSTILSQNVGKFSIEKNYCNNDKDVVSSESSIKLDTTEGSRSKSVNKLAKSDKDFEDDDDLMNFKLDDDTANLMIKLSSSQRCKK